MAKTITKQQYLQLAGLLTLAERYTGELEEIERAAREITGEDDEWGHTGDAIYGTRSIAELLKLLEITVDDDTDTWESLGRGFVEHEPDQTTEERSYWDDYTPGEER